MLDNVKTAESYTEEENKKETEILNEEIPDVDISKLVGNQQRIFLKVLSHYQQILAGTDPPPLRINIDGTAGTGKSFLISAITKAVTNIALERGHPSPIIRMAPTANAAFNIHGTTIHQSLSLPKSELPPLNNQQKGQLQRRWEGCKYIILDEKSMVGRRLLSKMDARLRDAFPEKQNEMFGGCSILLLGDFGQLPPVGDLPLFNLHASDRGKPEAIMASNKGRALFMSLMESITLDRIMRQQGENPSAVQFRQVLSNLQSMEATEADCQFLNTRYIGNLSAPEVAGFEDAVYLCPTNQKVDEINESKMSASGKPVLIVPARNKGPGASSASDDEAEGLAGKLLLMEGAKVMLTRNIWTTKGLTNGSMGTIGTAF